MQTNFSIAQLADPDIANANEILRACVHCGFCTATCPTYVLLGDELDSPRGRIYLIKDMLEKGAKPSANTVKHVDRCLSCLSCMTTCPSGVNYMHLVDLGRKYIEETFTRPRWDRWLRTILATVLSRPRLFRMSLLAAWFARPCAALTPGRLGALLRMAPVSVPSPSAMDRETVFPATGPRKGRVALLWGCAQQVLSPQINEATVRLLTRHGVEVVNPESAGCCGALAHHLGKTSDSHIQAAANIRAWVREIDGEGLDAILINASGCGTTVKDYGFMFREDAARAKDAARVSAKAMDISEYLETLDLPLHGATQDISVAYHAACSLQHGQKITTAPKGLLKRAGFDVRDVAEGHLCCGSAGTYNLLQPELATRLRDRKVENIDKTGADVVAAGNIGCIMQIASGVGKPVLHTVELLDWATGGPLPKALSKDR
ncbi:MAG: glycolate oxidase subunit GlcF [Alphaproteobacteria bacterium]